MNAFGDAIVIWAEGQDLRSGSYDSREGWDAPVLVALSEPGTRVDPRSAVMSGADAVTLWTMSSGSSTALVVVRRQAGRWGTPEIVGDVREPAREDLAIASSGSLIVVWSDTVSPSSRHVRASVSARGQPWVGVLDVPGTEPWLTSSPAGDVALIAASDIFEPSAIWIRRFDGQGFAPPEYVRAPNGPAGLAIHPALALGGANRDLASWWEIPNGAADFGDLWTASRDRSGSWGSPERMGLESASNRTCEEPARVTDLPPRPSVASSGVATVAWSEESCGSVRLAASSRVLPIP
jgi:hypothetical protein